MKRARALCASWTSSPFSFRKAPRLARTATMMRAMPTPQRACAMWRGQPGSTTETVSRWPCRLRH
eukprot:13242831-Alexandrium_andersonii.AAC.1